MMKVRVERGEVFVTPCRTRLPFKFGAVVLREAWLCTLRLSVATDAEGVTEGWAADLMVPKWFEKDPKKSVRQDVAALGHSVLDALDTLKRQEAATVFSGWRALYAARVAGVAPDAPDRLVRGFGVALCERALMDAASRAAGVSFFEALSQDLFHFRPGEVSPELHDWDPASALLERPQSSVVVRHTVGALDPLRVDDIPADERCEDGLPQALEEDIAVYGVRCFKVKVGMGPKADLARLRSLAAFFRERRPQAPVWTIDGNEQMEDLAQLAELLQTFAQDDDGRWMLEALALVEQPLSRKHTFDPGRNAALPAVDRWAPVIIDEADTGLEAFPRARVLGYRGVSIKNCKGIFRGLINRGLCQRDAAGAFVSAEDLTNLGGLPLQQNLATVCALGFPHVEMNGHHYFAGLDHLAPAEARGVLAAHPDLYHEAEGRAALAIADGEVRCKSLQVPGYGYGFEPLATGARSLEDWLTESP